MIDLNPLDVLKIRKTNVMPVHFVKIQIDDWFSEIDDWIKINLKGRYSISRLPHVNNSNSLKVNTFLGFEDQKEMTFFMLACPHLRRN